MMNSKPHIFSEELKQNLASLCQNSFSEFGRLCLSKKEMKFQFLISILTISELTISEVSCNEAGKYCPYYRVFHEFLYV